jgi:hypothetical protein
VSATHGDPRARQATVETRQLEGFLQP